MADEEVIGEDEDTVVPPLPDTEGDDIGLGPAVSDVAVDEKLAAKDEDLKEEMEDEDEMEGAV